MDLGLGGKVAMVAAGTKGIGLAVAKLLAEEGALVSVCARDNSNFHALLTVLGAEHRAFPCDVTRAEELAAWHDLTVKELGAPDILVTNTGGPPAGFWQDLTDDQWQAGFDSTLLNIVRLVRLVSPGMVEKGWGRIVHITSWVAVEPHALLATSSTLRAGVNSLTRLQATELAGKGVTVNSVLPGHTLTERQIHLAEVRAEKEGISVQEALQKQAEASPMKRLAEAHEIASPVVYLCSQQASFITGVNLLVDGGITRGPG
jgi:3-oxoacyl-[acyl-carrier protein] reductase